MAAMTDVLIPALEDAREAHAAVVDRFRTDAAITPPGTHRQSLERRLAEAQDQLRRIEDRVHEMYPRRGLLSGTRQLMWLATRSAARAAMVPVEAGVSAVTEMVRGERPADERRLLRNAEDEYAAAARALATCQAGKDIAEQLHDQETAELLRALRRQNEQLLETLEDHLAQRARAVAATTNGHRAPTAEAAEGRGPMDVLLPRIRATVAQLQTALRTGTESVKGTAGEVQGAITREQDLPIPGFSQFSVKEIQQRLRALSQKELTVIEGYERAHTGRPGVLNAIQHLRATEPWTGYDTMDPDEIVNRLKEFPPDMARQALEYERRHQERPQVMSAAQTRLHG